MADETFQFTLEFIESVIQQSASLHFTDPSASRRGEKGRKERRKERGKDGNRRKAD